MDKLSATFPHENNISGIYSKFKTLKDGYSFKKCYYKILFYYASHASVPPFMQTNTFLASLTEEHLQREVTPSHRNRCIKLVV